MEHRCDSCAVPAIVDMLGLRKIVTLVIFLYCSFFFSEISPVLFSKKNAGNGLPGQIIYPTSPISIHPPTDTHRSVGGLCLVGGNGGWQAFELFAGFGGSGATLEAKKLPTLLHSLGMAISDEDVVESSR